MTMNGVRVSSHTLQRILHHFPHTRHVIAYGSGVFSQGPHSQTHNSMLDLLFVVDSPSDWHQQNIVRHPQHYSSLGRLALRTIPIQEAAAGIYYNPAVDVGEGPLIKYGILSVQALLQDLYEWKHLYVAGRLHKPHVLLDGDNDVSTALDYNLLSACRTALLLLPRTFSEQQLFMEIAKLSYSGDFRMGIGEHPKKVHNIVNNGITRFKALYEKPIGRLVEQGFCRFDSDRNVYQTTLGNEQIVEVISQLPRTLRIDMFRRVNDVQGSTDEYIDELSADSTKWKLSTLKGEEEMLIRRSLRAIVQRSSIKQGVKGLISAGPWKAVEYAAKKVQKARIQS